MNVATISLLSDSVSSLDPLQQHAYTPNIRNNYSFIRYKQLSELIFQEICNENVNDEKILVFPSLRMYMPIFLSSIYCPQTTVDYNAYKMKIHNRNVISFSHPNLFRIKMTFRSIKVLNTFSHMHVKWLNFILFSIKLE